MPGPPIAAAASSSSGANHKPLAYFILPTPTHTYNKETRETGKQSKSNSNRQHRAQSAVALP